MPPALGPEGASIAGGPHQAECLQGRATASNLLPCAAQWCGSCVHSVWEARFALRVALSCESAFGSSRAPDL